MKRIALLVDWENLYSRLGDLRYPTDPRVLAPKLREAAEKVARQEVGGYVCYHSVFAPASAFRGQVVQQFGGYLDIEPTLGGKNAADLAIVVEALRLHYKNEADVFILVTGDIDYIVLAKALAKDGRICHIWAIDSARTNIELRDWEPHDWIPTLLGLTPQPKPTPGDNLLFLFICSRLLDDGFFLGGPVQTLPRLQQYGLLADEKVSQLYAAWLERGRRKRDAVILDADGAERRGGRLTYELKSEVFLPLWLGTVCLHAVEKRLSMKGESSSRGDILGLLEHAGMESAERAELFETMITAGYLVGMDDRFTGRSSMRRDLFGGALRVTAQVWYTQLERGWEVVGIGHLSQRWERVVRQRGELSAVDKADANEEVRAVAKTATASGAIAHGVDKDGRRGYRLNTKHPLVQFCQESIRTVVIRLSSRGAMKASPVRYAELLAEFNASPVNWTKGEVDFWLSVCAGERIVTWKQGQVWLNKSRFQAKLCDEGA